MTFKEFRIFAEVKMAADWLTTPIEFENLSESIALTAAKNNKTPWVRFLIRDGDGNLVTIGSGSRLDRYVGVLIIQIFVAQKTGTSTAAGYADTISNIWKGFNGQPCLQFFTPSINIVGENQGWSQINVNVTFQNDELT